MNRFILAAALVSALSLCGCDLFGPDPLIEVFNRRLAPADLGALRLMQTERAVAQLGRTAEWDAFVGVSAPQVDEIVMGQLKLAHSKLNDAGIAFENLAIRMEDQAVLISGRVTAHLMDAALTIKGEVTGAAVPAIQGDVIEIRYVVDRIVLSNLTWTGSSRPRNISAALLILQALIDGMLKNLNGLIQPSTIPVSIAPLAPIDPRSLRIPDAIVDGTPLAFPQPRLAGAVFLIDENGIRALVDFALSGDPAQEDPATASGPEVEPATSASKTFAVLKARFREAEAAAFGVVLHDPQLQVRMAITRRFLSRAFNLAAAKLDWMIHLQPKPQAREFDSEVRLFKVPDPQSCTQKKDNRECSPHNCERPHDTRNCSVCLVRRPWGGCALQGNDPFCEASKAAQNKIYEANHALCEADAGRRKATCEAAKAGQNAIYAAGTAACQAGNTIVRELADLTGRVGRISGTVNAHATGAIALLQLGVTDAFDAVTVAAPIQANADVSARMNFVQSDLVGHLLCHFPMEGKTAKARATLDPDSIAITGRIVGTGSKPEILLGAVSIRFQLRPRPIEALFTQNPELNVTCAGAASLAWLGSGLQALGMTNLPEVFTGNFEQDIDEQHIPLELPRIDVPIPGRGMITLQPSFRPALVVFETVSTGRE